MGWHHLSSFEEGFSIYFPLLPTESTKGSLECNLIKPLITMSYIDDLLPFFSSPISYPLIQSIKIQQWL